MNEYSEKRDFLRMAIDCELSFSVPGDSRGYPGKVINLSSEGILFSSAKALEVGTLLEVVLTPGNSVTPPMQARVRVARVQADGTLFDIAGEIEDS